MAIPHASPHAWWDDFGKLVSHRSRDKWQTFCKWHCEMNTVCMNVLCNASNWTEIGFQMSINNKPALVQIMAWCRKGNKWLSATLVVLFTDACLRHSASMRHPVNTEIVNKALTYFRQKKDTFAAYIIGLITKSFWYWNLLIKNISFDSISANYKEPRYWLYMKNWSKPSARKDSIYLCHLSGWVMLEKNARISRRYFRYIHIYLPS